MATSEEIRMSEAVAEALQAALTRVVEDSLRAGLDVSDRALMTGIATVFLEGMALTLPPDKWEFYVGSLVNERTIKELTAMREVTARNLAAAKAKLGIKDDEDLMKYAAEKLGGRSNVN